ncbi:hypothetical protein CPC08DRAFT_705089 [Agrocybe pediades]|nr:hypothetical protein CPC08DRAFT_705089 [Agrocybe pediades]
MPEAAIDPNGPPADAKLIPFPPDLLPVDHQKQIVRIRTCLIAWIMAWEEEEEAKGDKAAQEALAKATEDLAGLQVDPPYAFDPPPPYKFRSVLLSCIKCYWMALVKSLSEAEKAELGMRLDLVPPFGDRVPKFDGKKCVEKPGELNQREYEGIMRVTNMVIVQLTSNEVVRMWRELAQAGVLNWEERD